MTSPEDVRPIERFYENWARGDIEGALECTTPDVELDWSESIAPFMDVYRGHDAIRLFWHESEDAWDEFGFVVEQVRECGAGRVVVRTRVNGRASATGLELEARGAMLWVVRGGKIVSGKLFQSMDGALAATDG